MDDMGFYKPGMRFDLENEGISRAMGFRQRLLGLSGKRGQKLKCLYFVNCFSVHTFGMKDSLRVTYLDKEHLVISSSVVKPNRLCISPRHTYIVVEEVLTSS